jgi:hypothetical protein
VTYESGHARTDRLRAWSEAGGVIGVGLGFVWTSVFHTSSFEGYSGMLVFFTFMPIGIFVGGCSAPLIWAFLLRLSAGVSQETSIDLIRLFVFVLPIYNFR